MVTGKLYHIYDHPSYFFAKVSYRYLHFISLFPYGQLINSILNVIINDGGSVNMYDLGEIIKQLRKEKGYTQMQLAEKLNKSKSTISKYESNQKSPPLDTLIDISVLFHVSLNYLAGIEKEKSISIHGLTPAQTNIITALLMEFSNKKKYKQIGLTKNQLEIINEIFIEFHTS